jgi:hypothetical protein
MENGIDCVPILATVFEDALQRLGFFWFS